MADNKINVGGRLHSIATGNILAGADEILDDNKGKKQSEINIDIDNALANRYTKDETYNKNELNSLITTPDVQYVSVTATDQTTAVTDVLPITGVANTIYRVGNWDGSQFDASVYSEYAWNDSQYIHLSTKTQIGEVFDISAYHATGGELAKYVDLTAALDSNNGGGVPQSLQKGGMSVKFVRTSDNKYVQYRLMSDTFNTTPSDWQGVDEKPTAYSKNLVESEGVEKTKVTIKPGKNLLNPATCKAGFRINRTTGEEVANGDYFVSDFIPVSENGLYCAPFSYGGTNSGAAVYNSNKEYLRSAGNTGQYTYQSGDAYIRYTLDRLETMVEEGTAYTGYVAFNPVGGYTDEKYHKLALKTGCKIAAGYYSAGVEIRNIDILPIPIGTTIKNNGVTVALNGINDERVLVKSGNIYTTAFEVALIKTHSTATGDVDFDVYGDLSFNDVKGNLPFNRVDIDDNAINGSKINSINGSKIVDKSLEIEKLKDTEVIVGVNKLNVNDPDFLYEQGEFIKRTDGTIGRGRTDCYGYTGFIPVSKSGLYFNAFIHIGNTVGAAVYNANKQWLRSATNPYFYQDGDAYIRYTLTQNPVSPYLEGQFQVNEGTTGLPYEEYKEKTIISKDVLPETSYEQIPDDIKKDIMGYNVDISIPSVIPVVVGDRLQIFWKSIIVAPNPYIFDVYAVSGSKTCKSYPRYLQCDPTAAGNISVTIYVKSPSGLVIKSKTITIKAIAPMTAPASNTKILLIGASATAKGYIADELRRRLTTKSGTAILTTSEGVRASIGDTYSINGIILTVTEPSANYYKQVVVSSDEILDIPNSGTLIKESGSGTDSIIYTNKEHNFNNPIGLGLNNFEFVGRKTGISITDIHQDATGGWTWHSFAYSGQLAYRFQVTGVNLIAIGSTYRDSNSQFVFEVTETNITDGAGNIRCTYTGSGTIPENGTLTLVSGDSDATITYTSFEQEAGNPFWNPVTNKLDFTSYANEYCGGSIDVIISHLGMNNIQTAYTDLQALFDGAISDFITAYHAEFPNGKFIFSTLPLGSATGGLGSSYGANYFWNFYTLARALWDFAEFARNYFATNGFDYVYVADVIPIFDCENLYPSTSKPVNNRSSVTELLGTNGVHPLEIGSRTVADAIYEKINDVL